MGATHIRSQNPQEASLMRTPRSKFIERCLELARIDFTPANPQPPALRVLVASALSIGGSLLADVLLVALGTAVFPTTKGYIYFRFSDYASLTCVGVVIACAAWPIVTRISSSPRWLFFRLAILATLVLLVPDLGLLITGQPPKAVAVLIAMHLAIALVTYNALVHIAPAHQSKGRIGDQKMTGPVGERHDHTFVDPLAPSGGSTSTS
jgi:hypothetical protein